MLGFTLKRFLITLGISVFIWVISIMIQFIFKSDNVQYGFFIFAKSCEVTGYPIAKCIPDYDKGQIFLTYFINISFWFFIIHLFWGFFQKRSK